MFHVVFCIILLVIYMQAAADQVPRLEKRVLSFIFNYLVSVPRGFLFLLVVGIGCVILLWHSIYSQFNYFVFRIYKSWGFHDGVLFMLVGGGCKSAHTFLNICIQQSKILQDRIIVLKLKRLGIANNWCNQCSKNLSPAL